MRIIMLLILTQVCFAHITEVMYNPPGSDNNQEYIEVFTNISLVNWTIADSAANDTLLLKNTANSSYVLIVEEGYECNNITCYSAGTTIGNNLNNGEDEIRLYDENLILVDTLGYDGSLANNNNLSISLCDSWIEAVPTPGFSNNCEVEPINISVNISINSSTNTSTPCANITISSDFVFEEGEKIKYKISTAPVEYWVEDISGKVVKKTYVSANTNQKSWTPKCSDGSVFVLKARQVNCTDVASRHVIVKCQENKEEFSNELQIKEICTGKDDCAEFGETIQVELKISKGDSSKTAIQMYATGEKGKVTETTKLYATEKNAGFDVSLPLEIFDNCEWKYGNGTYKLIVTGLDQKVTKKFEITGRKKGACKEKVVIEETDCPVCEKSVYPEIKSFYTLAKKYSDKIKLYANVDCPGNCSLVLSNSTGPVKHIMVNGSGKVTMNTQAYADYRLDLCVLNNSLKSPFVIPKKEVKPSPKPVQAKRIEKRRGFRVWLMQRLGLL